MIYRVKAEEVSPARRILRSLCFIVVFILCVLLFHTLFPSNVSRQSFIENYGIEGTVGVLTALFFESARKAYDLEVDDERMMTRRGSFGNRTVRKGHIRYFYESQGNFFHEPNLRLSERGAIGRFFFGYVSIPASLPEYQEIKEKARTWIEIF